MKNQTVQTVVFETVAPYPEPVQIAELLSDIEAVIKRHVVLKEQAAAALAVWVLHTYTFELRDTVAYVAIESPEKRCGKTTLLSVLAAMAHKPLIASNVTVGALFRAIDTCRPALFIDEADTFLAGNGTMRGIMNSGNTWRTAYVLRLSRGRPGRKGMNADGAPASGTASFKIPTTNEPGRRPALRFAESGEAGFERFSCWCPKVIAMIGRVPDTIADRSIVVRMARKLVNESCAPLAELDTTAIRARCVRFALDAGPAIAKAAKIRGEGLNDRAADTFDPLCVIARLAGGGWEEKLHEAGAAQEEHSGTAILLDVLTIFLMSGCERLFSRDLVEFLRTGFGGVASQVMDYSSINEYRLSQMLQPYGIRALSIRVGKVVRRGYIEADFHEALRRYVPEAEFKARLAEMDHRGELQREARAEAEAEAKAEKEVTMMKEMLDKALILPFVAARLKRLKKEGFDDVEDEAGSS